MNRTKYKSKEELLEHLEKDRDYVIGSMEKAWRQFLKYKDRQWVVIYLDRYNVPSYVTDFFPSVKIMDAHLPRYGIPLVNFNFQNVNADNPPDYDLLWEECLRTIRFHDMLEEDYSALINPNGCQEGQISLFGNL